MALNTTHSPGQDARHASEAKNGKGVKNLNYHRDSIEFAINLV